MSKVSNKQMKIEMIQRLCDQFETFRHTMYTLELIDRIEDYDLIDQMETADDLMTQMDKLLARMNNIVR